MSVEFKDNSSPGANVSALLRLRDRLRGLEERLAQQEENLRGFTSRNAASPFPNRDVISDRVVEVWEGAFFREARFAHTLETRPDPLHRQPGWL